jgi:hypothetical protein
VCYHDPAHIKMMWAAFLPFDIAAALKFALLRFPR